MNMNYRILIPAVLTASIFMTCCSASESGCSLSEFVYMVGDREVRVLEHSCGEGGFTIFNMHDDEDTAVEASLEVIRKYGGRLIELRHNGERLISFRLGTESYRVDPNRIFTDSGLRKTLENYSTYSRPAFDEVNDFASALLSDFGLDNTGLIVTAHNNGKDEYSAESYLAGAAYENDASQVFIAEGSDPDDFFFVTGISVFEKLKEAGFNVVLQNNQTVTDDGSLSVLAGRKGIPYINCEAEKGHLEEQIRMLEAVVEIGE
jgi:hypothetical protein